MVQQLLIAAALVSGGDLDRRGSAEIDTVGLIQNIREQHKLPGLAVVVVKNGTVAERAAVGVRKTGDPALITTNDLFHIGSCTKSMTATVAAKLVEAGKVRWDTTVLEVFPELKGEMKADYEKVTLEQLLTHRGGVPGKPPIRAWLKAQAREGTPQEQRKEFVQAVLKHAPEARPGSKFIYSNQGYAIAGAMLEKLTGTSWEVLMTNYLFRPLKMTSAGFGPPGTPGKVDQPWGHTRLLGMTTPMQEDNPPAIGPAGTVHLTLDDLARYAIFHLQGERHDGWLRADTVRKLHTAPTGGDYAFGWGCGRNPAAGRILTHAGSNTMWYVFIWLAPEKDMAILVGTNLGGDDAEKATVAVARELIKKYLPQEAKGPKQQRASDSDATPPAEVLATHSRSEQMMRSPSTEMSP